MDTLLHINLSQQSALQRRMDVIANNVANMSTAAYKGEEVLFERYLEDLGGEGPRSLNEVNYLLDFGTLRSLEDGPVQTTQNPLDIALQGPGYFTVESEDGTPLYTRRGHLALSVDGTLVTRGTGLPVLDANGQRIDITPEDGTVKIAADGTISGDQGLLTQLGLASFGNERNLLRLGNSLFDADGEQPLPADGLTVIQGAIEGSNINPIRETTKMIEAMRAYERAKRSDSRIDELREDAIRRLGRVS